MENIVRALLSTAAFLELSGDEVVDTDAAVQALEQLSGYLQRAGEAEREVIARIAKEWAAEARAKGSDGAASANFYESFFESMGLDE